MIQTRTLLPPWFVLTLVLIHSVAEGANGEEKDGRATEPRPLNVLMIAIDDLNDWVEPLGGHPQVKTPAIKGLADRGVMFSNAHCQSPLCNPSRTSLMLSLRPETTGIYGLKPWFRNLKKFQKVVSLPQHFAQSGYETYTAGKIYHSSLGRKPPQGCDVEFNHWGPRGGPGIMPKEKLIPPTPNGNNGWVDWGTFDHEDADKGDYKVASWAESTISKMPRDKPFFMAVGFFLPHVPCHVTKQWWDLYPDETLVMPPMNDDDLNDCPPFSQFLHWQLPEPRIQWLRKHKQHRNLVRSYLASVSFCDAQVQRVLDALEKSPHADDTIVVLWSDHGFHLGEKDMTGKTTLWKRSTRVPLIFAGPGIKPGVCQQPAELLDVFPTLSQLANMTPPSECEGVSLLPQLNDPSTERDKPAITTHNPGNFSICDDRYRLIHYADGSEELYDSKTDPDEFKNLISDVNLAAVADRLKEHLPSDFANLVEGSAHRILEQKDGQWYWENQLINPENRSVD